MKEKHRATDKNISVAFEDLSKLMEKVGSFFIFEIYQILCIMFVIITFTKYLYETGSVCDSWG